MNLTERHHAYIVLGFYKALTDRGPRGREAFVKAAQVYGESRGRRMAMRAIRDGRALDFTSYFAYSEWEASEGAFDSVFEALPGCVDERVTRCPWAEVFAGEEALACGLLYCGEIDRAIVRGFNPALTLDVASVQHDGGCCQFYFRDDGIGPDLFARAEALPRGTCVREFAYHCADAWRVFSNVAVSVFGPAEGERIIADAEACVAGSAGGEVLETVRQYDGVNFDQVS